MRGLTFSFGTCWGYKYDDNDLQLSQWYSVSKMSTCTPHFKQDAQNAWITQDGEFKLCIWLHPQSSITLEDAARLIDEYVMSRLRQGPGGHLTPDQVVDRASLVLKWRAAAQLTTCEKTSRSPCSIVSYRGSLLWAYCARVL